MIALKGFLRLIEKELIAVLAIAIILGSLVGYTLAATKTATITVAKSEITRSTLSDDDSN
jgi:hypothetical protein